MKKYFCLIDLTLFKTFFHIFRFGISRMMVLSLPKTQINSIS